MTHETANISVLSHPEFNIRHFWLCNAVNMKWPQDLHCHMWALGSI
jgi:hypothetical protein